MSDKNFTRMDAGRAPWDHADVDSTAASEKREPTPNVPIRAGEIDGRAWAQGVRFGGAEVALGVLGGSREIGVNLVILAPGKQSCPHHYHVHEEEHFYVLEGRVVLRSGDESYTMETGDYVCFPAGTGVAHSFENPHEAACHLLAIGSRKDHEIAVYPKSGKMKLRALGRIVPWAEESMDYWDGEAVDEPIPSED